MLLIKLQTIISSTIICSFKLIAVLSSWSQSSKQLGIWLARGKGGPLVLSSPSLTSSRSLGLTPPGALLADVPGSLNAELTCSSFSIPFLLNHHFVFVFFLFFFFFCLALKKNNITKFPNVHSRVRISSSTPVVEDTQS